MMNNLRARTKKNSHKFQDPSIKKYNDVINQDISSINIFSNIHSKITPKSSRDVCIDIAGLAVQAMLYEVSCHPSPGLVTKASLGAHQDMDYFTFLDSAAALIHPLLNCAEAGFSSRSPKEIFRKIRLIGQSGEEQMFQKTAGINTHKGMLFLLGVCCAAGAKALYGGRPFSSLPEIIQEMAEGLVEQELNLKLEEFRKADPALLTYGERLFLDYGIEGIRGEVEKGLPTVFGFSLQYYKEQQGLSQNQRLVQTLLGIMQYCEDSNILHRHTPQTLQEVQNRARQILSIGGVTTPEGLKALDALAEDFAKRKISPGGSADLLGVTVFISLLEDYLPY